MGETFQQSNLFLFSSTIYHVYLFQNQVKAVAIDLHELIHKIKTDQRKRVKIEDPIVFNVLSTNCAVEQSTTGLNGQFLHSQLLIDVLLRLKSSEEPKQKLIKICEEQYKGNESQLVILREFQKTYSSQKALWWYSRESFLYKILNKALRVQNIDLLFLLRFLIHDIYQELNRNQCQTSIQVYRGQVLSTDELKSLQQSIDQFISVNSFFSTTSDRNQAIVFLYESDVSNDLHRVLFEIDANPKAVTNKPFANITSFCEHSDEAEVLFMIGAIFRLRSIEQNDDQIWTVQLTLCGDQEHELNRLFKYIKKSQGGGNADASLLHFGRVLRQMGKFDLAEKFYLQLLDQTPSNESSLCNIYYSLGLVLKDKHDLDLSLYYIQTALQIWLDLFPNKYTSICNCYNELGSIHQRNRDYEMALLCYQQGMELLKQNKDTDSLTMAHFYNNIAIVYKEQKKYSDALDFNEIALNIRKKLLPSNHRDIGLSHNNIGNIYSSLGDYNSALKHHCQGLNIRIQSLPSNHPHVAQSYRNIGLAYENLDALHKALQHLEKALTIRQQTLRVGHEDLVAVEKDIERVSSKLK